ncbi:MAG: WbqC family protein [Bacteroidia bacterium]
MSVMQTPVFSIQYVGNILFYYLINQYPKIYIEAKEYYVKQTFRNRTIILTANGVMPLIVPVVHKSSKEIISQKEISYKEKWHKKHYTAIVSAYKNAPYFDYYAEELLDYLLYPKEHSLFNMNLFIIKKVCGILNIQTDICITEEYRKDYVQDYRNYFDADLNLPSALNIPYLQVFSDRFPFQKNLCVLDLIFNLGNDAKAYISGEFKL